MNQIGISFSESIMHIAYSLNGQVKSITRVPYPFAFSYESLFNEENVTALAEVLKSKINEEQGAELEICVSLPMNYVHIKKIALPTEADSSMIQAQVEWEFKNYLSGDIEQYKIINTQIEFLYETYREVIFVALKKEILKAISLLAEKSEAVLKKVVPVNYLVEEILTEDEKKNNALVIKLENTHINSQLFINGKYYHSYLDNAQDKTTETAQRLFEISKNRFMETENILEQLPFIQDPQLNCYIYGDGLTPPVEKLFKENFTNPVIKLVSTQKEKSDSGLEAIQVLLS